MNDGEIPVFDGHNDAITREDHAGIAGGRCGGHVDLPRMAAGGVRGAIFSIFTQSPEGALPSGGVSAAGSASAARAELVPRDDGLVEVEPSAPVARADAAAHATAAAGLLLALERAGALVIAREIADVDRARGGDGPPVAVMHLEGAEAIDPELEALELWHTAGLRSLGPVWSRPNAFGHGVPFIWPSSPDTGPGLSAAGVALVRRCAELGILVDLSHLNEAGFWDVARMDLGPLVASHSAAHALCSTSRNLTDAQIDAIGATGGLVGIVFACPFLRPDFADDEDTDVALIAEHARYIAGRIGAEHVGLGSDFDGATVPRGVGDVAGMPRVLEALADAGFTRGDVQAIAWGNWRRVLAAWWGR